MRLKKFILVLCSLALLIISTPAQAGNDTSWIPRDPSYTDATAHGFAFTDKLALPFQLSLLEANSQVCSSTSDPNCASSSFFKFNSILKACDAADEVNCITSLSALDENGIATPATFKRYTVTNHINAFPADKAMNIPAGSMPSIWSIPSAPHASGDLYAVYAGITGSVNPQGAAVGDSNYMQIALIPVVLKDFGKGRQSQAAGWNQSIAGIYYDYCANSQQTDGTKFTDCAHVNGDSCIFPTNDQGMCYAEEPFGSVQKFNIQLKLAKEPSGWMHGRMVDPSISITPLTAGGVNLSVTAAATTVPMVYQNSSWADLSPEMQNQWVSCNSDPQSCGEFWFARAPGATSAYIEQSKTLTGNASINMIRYVNGFGAMPLKIMSAISPLIGNKSQSQSTTWSMRTLSAKEMGGANKCFTSTPGLKGIVTTNAPAYSAGPPAFTDGSLNYQVAAPHFNPDGSTPFKGNYNLVMRSDVARCIYGFSKAPISATISIVSSDGNSDVATTVAGEHNGWLSLSANNFQFSSPVIKVKLTQDAPAPIVTVKNSTITCVKGKLSKKITAIRPLCPAGFIKR